jgi:Sulfatase/Rhodopirellula transposase DDE domain
MTNPLGDRTVETIEGYAKARRPFLLSLHFTAPHWPWEGPDDEAESNRIRDIRDRDGGTQKTYGRMVQSLDANIGRVLQALDVHGLSPNTIVVFTSDNGGERFSKIWPFTGMKGELLEGGLRIPAIARWPGHVAAGSVSDQAMITMDWMPTILAAAGTRPDPAHPSDGENLAPALSGAASQLIGATTTKTGLKVDCALDTRTYQKGIKVSNVEMKALNITGDRFHPEWNYKIPTPKRAGARRCPTGLVRTSTATLTQASGTAERQAAQEMIVRYSPGARPIALGADKGYDAAAFVADLRALNVTPHIAQNITGRRSAIDSRATRHPGYEVSQQKRKRIEEPFGWAKTIGGLARPMLRGARNIGFRIRICPRRTAPGQSDGDAVGQERAAASDQATGADWSAFEGDAARAGLSPTVACRRHPIGPGLSSW